MKHFLLKGLLLAMLAISATYVHAQNRYVKAPFTESINGSHRTKWDIYDEFGNKPNGAVSSFQRCNGDNISFGVRERHANCVIFNFYNCSSVGKTYFLVWNTYNWSGSNVGSGSITVVITEPSGAVLQPFIAFSGISSNCESVNLCVTNPLPNITYTWSSPGVASPNGLCATYPVPFPPPPPPQLVSVTATPGCIPGNAVTTTQSSPGTFTPGVDIDGPWTACPYQGVLLTGFSNTCVPGAANWVWSSSCGTIFSQGPISGTESTAVFHGDLPGLCLIQLTVTDFQNVTSTAYFEIEVLDGNSPGCFFFKGDGPITDAVSDGTAIESDNAAIESRTDSENKAQQSALQALTLSPNPASDRVVINHTTGYDLLRVLDANGALLFQTKLPVGQDQYRLNTANFANGLYMLQLSGPDKPAETLKANIIH